MTGRSPGQLATPWKGHAGPRWPSIPPLPGEARAALRSMARALAGEPPPCAADPEAWTSLSNPAEADAAVSACLTCPAVEPCRLYAASLWSSTPWLAGVWGAQMFGPFERPSREQAS